MFLRIEIMRQEEDALNSNQSLFGSCVGFTYSRICTRISIGSDRIVACSIGEMESPHTKIFMA